MKIFYVATLATLTTFAALTQIVPASASNILDQTRISGVPTPTPTPKTSPSPADLIEEDNEVLRIDSDEVGLNVRVVDDTNRTIGNLTQSQFEVYEDGIRQPITSLTTAEVPTVNALVIDNSRSLRTQLGKIIEAGKILVATNRAKDESAIIRFTSADKIEVVQDFTPNKFSLDNALDNLFIEGGKTAVIDAVYQAARKAENYQSSQKKEDAKIRALILVTDGDDRSSIHDESQLLELLRKSQVQIYTIGFTGNLDNQSAKGEISVQAKAEKLLNRLAQETGGKAYFPASMNELPQIAKEISGELRTQYLISYAPTNDARDGSFRKINVVVTGSEKGKKLTAVTRTGRTAAPK